MNMSLSDFSDVRSLSLFDCHCRLGTAQMTSTAASVSVLQLIAEMDRCGIEESLVWHTWAEGYAPAIGNSKLLEEIRGVTRLHPCWVILPPTTGEIGMPAMIEQMRVSGVRAVKMFPHKHRFSLSSWSINELLELLNEHRLPLFLDFGRQHWPEDVVDYDAVFRICKEFSHLPVTLVREGIGSTRFLYPLFEKLDNFHIEISYYQAPRGLQEISREFGAKHLLFGTGLPTYAAGPPIMMLLQSELSSAEQKMIAGDNLRALIRGVWQADYDGKG